MHARLLCLLAFSACGPSVEVTSATISDSNSGSAEDDSAEDATCEGLPPEFLAFVDAFERFEAAGMRLSDRTELVRGELAAAMGLPADASVDAISASISAFYAATVIGAPTLRTAAVRCSGSMSAARTNLEICVPGLATEVAFECMGNCLVAAASDCPGEVRCRSQGTSCEGICTGACELEAGGPCEGTCFGACQGNCTCTDGDGVCEGTCDADCTGSCEIVERSCLGTCLGECESVQPTCAQALVCVDPGPYCTLDCESWARPAGVSDGCASIAALAGASEMNCAAPVAEIGYSSAPSSTCEEFIPTMAALEDAAGSLEALLTQIPPANELSAAASFAINAAVEADDMLPLCAIAEIQEILDRLGDPPMLLYQTATDAQALYNAIAQE